MQKTLFQAAALLLAMFVLAACGRNGNEPDLEQQVQELRIRIDALEQRHAQEIEDLRIDLKNVLTYLNIALDNLAARELQEAPDAERKEESPLKRALEENLRTLLDLSREMIDRLERELDRSMQRERPQGKR
jgi:outer membrane murein-binding lipoprotein Lpp